MTPISLIYTHHAQTRMSQRGITDQAVQCALFHGSSIYKQGYHFTYVSQKQLLLHVPRDLRDLVKNLIVVVDYSHGYPTIITCYKNPQAVKQIKKKTKYLIKAD